MRWNQVLVYMRETNLEREREREREREYGEVRKALEQKGKEKLWENNKQDFM